MEFVRPEVKAAAWRFRDALIGGAVSVFGMYWALNGIGILSIVGISLAIAGALLVFAGIQRGRFRGRTGGSGVVLVDEGQVTYFGPTAGGSVVVANLDRVELDPLAGPKGEWVLHDPTTAPLRIPVNAEAADTLFDVFSALRGFQTERMLAVLNGPPKELIVLWRSKPAALH